eukprot:GSMAST32.ASY1.ANO1.1354.1 assembled CDS
MLKQLSQRAGSLPSSGIRKVMALSAELARQGNAVIHLEVGQPGIETAQHIQEIVKSALQDPKNLGYCSNFGLDSTRKAVADHYNHRFLSENIVVQPENVLITPGAVFAIASGFMATLDVGDEVLIPDPGWVNYSMTAKMLSAIPVAYNLKSEDSWQVQLSEIQSKITDKTKMIVLCSPGNPTGAVFSQEILDEVLGLAHNHGLYVIGDEIYSAINYINTEMSEITSDNYHSPSLMQCSNYNPKAHFVVSGVSKAWAMTGFRVGTLVADSEIISNMDKLVESFVSCGVPFSQHAASVAFDPLNVSSIEFVNRAYLSNRDIVVSILNSYNIQTIIPEGV